jgi:FtsP/CotA-like multicopper oxidase with cupredoxin domain
VSRNNRLALIALAVVVAAVAFVLAQPGDEEVSAPGTTTSATMDTNTGPATVDELSEPETQEEPPPEPRPSEVRIRIRGGKPVGGIEKITVKKGDTVRIAVTSDVADHVHVHGYDKLADVPAGGTARLRFKADIEGVFEIELEDSHTQIASLTVEP